MITTKDLLKHSLVITIDDKRFDLFKRVFKYHNLSPIPRKFQGVTYFYNSGQYNCYLSHRNAILKAKKLKWPYVCIFEDDAYPIIGVSKMLDLILPKIPKDCKVLSLGTIANFLLDSTVTDDLLFRKGYSGYGAHSVLVFSDAYDDYVKMLDKHPAGDGVLYSKEDETIHRKTIYMPLKNLFIQFSFDKTVNNPSGYILYDKMMLVRKENGVLMCAIQNKDLSIPEDRAIELGFPKISDVFGEISNRNQNDLI